MSLPGRLILALTFVAAMAPVQAPSVRALERAEAGQYAAAIEELLSKENLPATLRRFRSDASRWLDKSPAESRERRIHLAAAFTLEILARGVQGTSMEYAQAVPLVEWMCQRLRKEPPTTAEHAFHLGSIALLQGAHDQRILLGDFLDPSPLEKRKDSHILHAAKRFPDDPRFKLAALTVRRQLQVVSSHPMVKTELVSGWHDSPVNKDDAIVAYTLERLAMLMGHDSIRDEVLLRRGIFLFLSGDSPAAIEDLRRATQSTDPFIRYLGHLVLGLLYERTNEMPAAIANYSFATKTIPATAASMALASALFRENRRAEAAEIVEALMRDPRPDDPWRQYEYGEYRFFSKYLQDLKGEIGR